MEINETARKKCSFCGEHIENDLNRCPFCASLQNIKIDSVIDEMKFDQKVYAFEQLNHNKEENKNPEKQYNNSIEKPLRNGLKVLITMVCTIIPGLGQLIGIIMGIVFMSNDDEVYGADKRSYGLALLVSNIILFVFTCILWFIFLLALAVPFNQ